MKTQKRPLIECTCCRGSGKVPLGHEMMEAYTAASGSIGVTAGDLAKILKWVGNVTAMNNRLRRLCAAGILSRRKEGREWVYYKEIK